MHLSNPRISAAITGLALLTGTVAAPTWAVPSSPFVGGTTVPAQGVTATSTQAPSGAVLGGRDDRGSPLYVCYARYNNGFHPGKVFAGNCNIGFGGREIVVRPPNYSYLITPSGYRPRYLGYNVQPPPGSVIPFVRDANGTPLFFCRAAYRGGIHPGKVFAGNCNIGFGGREIVVRPPSYEYLVFTR
jgi:hypothetical protein